MPAHHVDELRVAFAAQTAAVCSTAHISAPGIQRRRPSAMAAASVPLAIATVRGAPPIDRVGQRPVHRREEAGDVRVADRGHQSAPRQRS